MICTFILKRFGRMLPSCTLLGGLTSRSSLQSLSSILSPLARDPLAEKRREAGLHTHTGLRFLLLLPGVPVSPPAAGVPVSPPPAAGVTAL